jgi:FKBP-type peptidyl-prolyl cis-trans isomerase 2
MKVEKGKKIKMEYELGVEDGETIESSESRGPLEYVHGSGAMLSGLEAQIEGLEVGDEKSGVIAAADAYGTEESLPTTVLAKSDFPSDDPVEEGKVFEASDPQGNPIKFKVISMEDDSVTVRFLHPLAGKNIRFKVKILDISDPN